MIVNLAIVLDLMGRICRTEMSQASRAVSNGDVPGFTGCVLCCLRCGISYRPTVSAHIRPSSGIPCIRNEPCVFVSCAYTWFMACALISGMRFIVQ